jgi:predicted nucleic acid-binding Zn ribbon protein
LSKQRTIERTDGTRRCPICGTRIPGNNGRGRSPVYCSPKCRYQAKYRQAKHNNERNSQAVADNNQLRKTIEELETYVAWQRDEINRLRRELSLDKGYLRRVSNDLAALIQAGAVHVDHDPAHAETLRRHNGIIPIMERFEDRKTSPIQEQKKRVEAVRERQRAELDKARAESRNDLYIQGILSRHHDENRKLREECETWFAWQEISEQRRTLRDEYGNDMTSDIAAGRMGAEGKHDSKETDDGQNDTGRTQDKGPRGTAQDREGKGRQDQGIQETSRQGGQGARIGLPGLSEGMEESAGRMGMDAGNGHETRDRQTGNVDEKDNQRSDDGRNEAYGTRRSADGTATGGAISEPRINTPPAPPARSVEGGPQWR